MNRDRNPPDDNPRASSGFIYLDRSPVGACRMRGITRPTFWLAALSIFAAAAASTSYAEAAGNRAGALFNYQALYVCDLPKSAVFYETVLRLKRIPDPLKTTPTSGSTLVTASSCT